MLIVLFLFAGTNTASALYVVVRIDYGKYVKKTNSCDYARSFCRLIIDFGWGDSPTDSYGIPHDGYMNGDATLNAQQNRFKITLADAIPDGANDGKNRNKFTLHEDTPLSAAIADGLGLTDKIIVLKKGSYSFGGSSAKQASIRCILVDRN